MDEAAKHPVGLSPLSGVRVADLTTVVMGPLATRMLGDLGADVIRVETPEGDVLRDYEPKLNPMMSAFTLSLNRNKRCIVLNLKTAQGQQAMASLVASCDVFITNLRRAALRQLGLDADSVRAMRSDIIYCTANGFGSDGPHADHAAYDDVIQAASGLASMFTWSGDEPQFVPSIMVDKVVAVHIAFAVAAALHHRARTGDGSTVEVPMAETMAAFNLVENLAGLTFEPPLGGVGYDRIRTPWRRPRRTADGWIAILPYSNRNWDQVFQFSGRADAAADPRFATFADRVRHVDVLYQLLDEIVAEKTTAEWLEFGIKNSVPVSEVVDLAEIEQHPHFEAVGLMQHDDHPTEGPYRYARDTIRFNGGTSRLRRHASQLGADTQEVLTELGYTEEAITALLEEVENSTRSSE